MNDKIKIGIYIFLTVLALIFVLWLLKTIFSTPSIVLLLCLVSSGSIAVLVKFYEAYALHTWQGILTISGLGLAAFFLLIRFFVLLRRRSGKGPGLPKDKDPSLKREEHFRKKEKSERGAIHGSLGDSVRPVGCVDAEGNIYRGPEWMKEEPIASMDKQGTVYHGPVWNHQNPIGSIDKAGNIYREPAWEQREVVGSVDSDGNIYLDPADHQRHPEASVDKAGNIRNTPVWKYEYPASKQLRRAGAAAYILIFRDEKK